MKSVDILGRVDRGNYARGIDLRRKWQLDEDPVDPLIRVERPEQIEQLGLASRIAQIVRKTCHAGFRGRAVLRTDINRARRILSNEDGRQPRRPSDVALEVGDARSDLLADRR